ncbi:hypothetical protein MASR1M90_18770 [Desulfovibrionales bacterium]
MSEDTTTRFVTGRIIYGLHHGDLNYFDRPETSLWNDETEARYMEQVRERAQHKAREILEQALAEAEQIRARALSEGFESGRLEAVGLAQQEADKVADFFQTLHQALEAEKQRIYTQHKQTLFTILQLAFEKTLGIMLDDQRQAVLSALFDEAVTQLQATSTITVHVCPEDMDMAKELTEQAKTNHGLPDMILKSNPDLAPGGVRLESGDGMVDNSVTSRFEQVRSILHGYMETP